MTQSPPTGELVARLRKRANGWISTIVDDTAAEHGHQPGIYTASDDAWLAAERITTLERELEEARAALYLARNERDNARDHWIDTDATLTASQAEVERLKALVTDMTRSARKLELAEEERNRAEAAAEQPRLMDAGTRYWAAKQLVYSVAFRARAALQVEESKG